MSEQDLAELQFFASILTVVFAILNLAVDGMISIWIIISPLMAFTIITVIDLIIEEVGPK